MCNLFTKFITALKILYSQNYLFVYSEKGMWLIFVTNVKQIPEAFILQINFQSSQHVSTYTSEALKLLGILMYG
jgi:hypothetical protein